MVADDAAWKVAPKRHKEKLTSASSMEGGSDAKFPAAQIALVVQHQNASATVGVDRWLKMEPETTNVSFAQVVGEGACTQIVTKALKAPPNFVSVTEADGAVSIRTAQEAPVGLLTDA